MSIIKDILSNNSKANNNQIDVSVENFSFDKTYNLDDIKVCQLAVISNKKQRTLSSRDIISRIVKYDALMIAVKPNWYMDIESGKCYELGGMFGDKLQSPKNKYYIAGTESFVYTCYETIQDKNIDFNLQYSASEIRNIYNTYFENNTKTY